MQGLWKAKKGPGTQEVRQQNTHWYKTKGGFTANPFFASREEVERVGLHDCTLYECETPCGGSAQEYAREQERTSPDPS